MCEGWFWQKGNHQTLFVVCFIVLLTVCDCEWEAARFAVAALAVYGLLTDNTMMGKCTCTYVLDVFADTKHMGYDDKRQRHDLQYTKKQF